MIVSLSRGAPRFLQQRLRGQIIFHQEMRWPGPADKRRALVVGERAMLLSCGKWYGWVGRLALEVES